jgi:hypothetical protein
MASLFRSHPLRTPAIARAAVDSGRHIFRLRFQGEGEKPAKEIEFEANDAHEALVIAQMEARRRSAELWRDGVKLCTISHKTGDFWEIGSADSRLSA